MDSQDCGETDAEFSKASCRIVWLEPGDSRPRSVRGRIVRQSGGFVDIALMDGRYLRLRESFLVKVETEEGDPRD